MILRGVQWLGWLALGAMPVFGADPRPSTVEASDAVPDLFRLIPRIEIVLEETAYASLRTNPREYVMAQVREGSNTYTNVAIKLKGARGSFRYIDDKPAFTLNMDKFTRGQSFYGLDKLHLNNSVQDYTYLNEMICGELFRAAGVPTARATHARVKLNNRDLGFYVLKEGYDKRFLKRHFARSDGNLYDGGFLSDIDDRLERDSGSGPADRSDLDQLYAAAMESNLDTRLEKLERILDLERFISFAAMEMLTCDWDGYLQNRNNYRLYNDPSTGRFVFIPHGMDQMFNDVNYPLVPGQSTGRRGGWRRGGIVGTQAFQIPELQKRYIRRMGELLNTVFTAEKMDSILSQIDEQLRREIGDQEPRLATYMSGQVRYHRRQLLDRVKAARAQYVELGKMLPKEP